MNGKQRRHLEQMRETLLARLRVLEQQLATFGNSHVPAHIPVEIEKIKQEIAEIKVQLAKEELAGEESVSEGRTWKRRIYIIVPFALLIFVIAGVAIFDFSPKRPKLLSVDWTREVGLPEGSQIFGTFCMDAESYKLDWGSRGTASGSEAPFADSGPTRPVEVGGCQKAFFFQKVTDPAEIMWVKITLFAEGRSREYTTSLNIEGANNLHCVIDRQDTTLTEVSNCSFAASQTQNWLSKLLQP